MNSFILVVIGVLSLVSCSLKKDQAMKLKKIPPAVVEAFFKRHPEVQAHFEKQDRKEGLSFEADFIVNHKEKSERYSAEGVLLETEEEIDFHSIESAVHATIKAYLMEQDKKFKLLKAQKVYAIDFDGYELKVETKRSHSDLMEYFFNRDGSFHHQEELKLPPIPTLN